jgi:hypothetical protein
LNVPPASVSTALMTQVVRAAKGGGLRIGSGGPKKQFASSAQDPAAPPQSASAEQAGSELLLTQCRFGPAPCVQFFWLVPALGPSVPDPVICRNEVAPSGIRPPATTVADPPPK